MACQKRETEKLPDRKIREARETILHSSFFCLAIFLSKFLWEERATRWIAFKSKLAFPLQLMRLLAAVSNRSLYGKSQSQRLDTPAKGAERGVSDRGVHLWWACQNYGKIKRNDVFDPVPLTGQLPAFGWQSLCTRALEQFCTLLSPRRRFPAPVGPPAECILSDQKSGALAPLVDKTTSAPVPLAGENP